MKMEALNEYSMIKIKHNIYRLDPDTRPEKCQFNQFYLKSSRYNQSRPSFSLENYYFILSYCQNTATNYKTTLAWLLLCCMWPDLEITLQALSLLHWIKYTRCTDILWENTHRMHVRKVKNSISISSFRVVPAWLNRPLIVLRLLPANRKQQVEKRSIQNYGGENSQTQSWQ